MNASRRTLFLRSSRPAFRTPNQTQTQIHHLLQRRTYAAEPPPPSHPTSTPTPPNPNIKPPSRVAAFYRSFTYPILKCFLGALFTYQLTYYLWAKLEVVEEKSQRQGEIQVLKGALKDAVVRQKDKARGVGEKMEAVAEEGREKVEKKRWWPW
ncbi:hypothetical protein K458DRAFT_417766 [Lentithecium fluviatile CBS 122367]|uniref:Uncharacterized protein n=1 Tax=Lentithecium fluviatile CBS 122367 TaxID=1168545 RepID=A0A6G1J316_9PLEO|nr:hypothetical protein K458DRAFT_417766 [Lentithecium fluviatile CBS 122367]